MKRTEQIVRFIRRIVGEKGVVIGLSGGIDSAVVATLCVKALGNEKVYGLLMPEKGVSLAEDVKDAEELAVSLGIKFEIWPINNPVKGISSLIKTKNKSTLGNLKARVRMTLLYAYANENMLLVAGTGNKSEIITGYFTKYGDGGVDFLPMGDLCKTEVFELAKELGVPQKIIDKKPSAGLWRGQTDEDEIGVSYGELDKAICGGNVSNNIRKKVNEMVKKSEHKRKMPEICNVH